MDGPMGGAAPRRSPEEARANAAFAAILGALSRPGTMHHLPDAGEGAVMAALVDRECRVHAAGPALAELATAFGARLAPIETADHVLLGTCRDAEVLGRVPSGSDLYPDRGATVILRARIGHGAALRLSGPGVAEVREVWMGGLPHGFWSARDRAARYPMGFDLLLIDGTSLMGVPRSTRVEVL